MSKGIKPLLKLAGKIKDKKLKKKVTEFLKETRPKHRGFKKGVELDEAPASEAWHHTGGGGLVKHIESVTKIAIAVADVFQEQYGEELDMDALIAASLCHDLMKTTELEKVDGIVMLKLPMYLDHLTLGVAELYARKFPPKVIHIAAAHHGESGPVSPTETEAIILHFADSIDAYANTEELSIGLMARDLAMGGQ